MQFVRSAAGFLAVNLFFIAISCAAAGLVWLFGTLTLRNFPDATDDAWPWILIGFAAVAVSIWAACKFIAFTSRRPR